MKPQNILLDGFSFLFPNQTEENSTLIVVLRILVGYIRELLLDYQDTL